MLDLVRTPLMKLSSLWSATAFQADELTHYAERFMTLEVRRGVAVLGIVSLLLLSGAAILYQSLGFSSTYVYTCVLLGLLALHITLSSRTIKQTRVLYLLSMTLLIVSGSAFVLLAHQTGSFSAALLSSVVLLFMVIPMVPWGMREAITVVAIIYLVFTASTFSVEGRFDRESLWILQFLMAGSALATLTIVARNVGVRKNDIQARFDLENAHQQMERLSYEDGLTGVWNRRFLDIQFKRLVRRFRECDEEVYFALLDLDDFKYINDNHGHIVGDEVLRSLATGFKKVLGDHNYVFRVGGDEFAVLLSGAEPEKRLHKAAESTRELVTKNCPGLNPPVRISIGVILIDRECDVDLDILYKETDKALYQAKSRKHENQNISNLALRLCTPRPMAGTGV